MKLEHKKTPKRVQPIGVRNNFYKNIIYTNHKSKMNFLQRLFTKGGQKHGLSFVK